LSSEGWDGRCETETMSLDNYSMVLVLHPDSCILALFIQTHVLALDSWFWLCLPHLQQCHPDEPGNPLQGPGQEGQYESGKQHKGFFFLFFY